MNSSATTNPTPFDLKADLQTRMNDIADEIAFWRADRIEPAEMRGFVRGVIEMFWVQAERAEIDLPVTTLDCALGEYEERRGIEPQTLNRDLQQKPAPVKSRILKKMIREIRQFRIAFRKAETVFLYKDWYVPRQKKLWAMERRGEIENWEEWNMANRELRELFNFTMHEQDLDWHRKRDAFLKSQQPAEAA